MTDSMFSDAEMGAPKPYVVLARKYRPAAFPDLIGQQAMVTTLENAFRSGRIAQGYMLTGVRGVGKTTTARILARALNYEPRAGDGGKAAGPTTDMPALGVHCAEIMESRHPDVVEMDAASNTGVDNIREIIESARYKPLSARYKVFIIDEVHMLSKGAFNALLKTLEEPPEHVKFIFATTEIRKVPVTVLSRCQRFDLRRVDVPELVSHFARIVAKESAEAEPEALALIARAAGGSVRDGLSILDQAIAMGEGKVDEPAVRAMLGLADKGRVFDLLDVLFAGEAGPALTAFAGLLRDGADPYQLLADLCEAVHISTRVKAVGAEAASEGLSAEERRRAARIAESLSMALLSRTWQMLLKGLDEVARAPNPAAAAEMVLVRICYASDLPSPDEIIKALGGALDGAPRRPSLPPGANAAEAARTALAPMPAPNARARREPVASARQPSARPASAGADEFDGDDDAGDRFDDVPPVYDETAFYAGDEATGAAVLAGGYADPKSFEDVIALLGEHREARLKYHVEEHVSLVRFDHASGAIDVFLLPGAPGEVANELREKLNAWTGRRWMVVLSKSKGAEPYGETRRKRVAAEIEALKAHPAVKAVLDAFPDARIDDVRAVPRPAGKTDESAAG